MDSTSTCNTKPLEKETYRKYNKQPKSILFKPSPYQSNQIYSFEKLTVRELYLISLQHETTTPTSQEYFESMFQDLTLQWKHIYALPRITTIDCKL